jgi:starch synthase
MAFQQAVLAWVNSWEHRPDVIHCHDYHSGLIPFMMYYAPVFSKLKNIPTVFTIHSAMYQGWMGWDKKVFLPDHDVNKNRFAGMGRKH